MPPPQAEQPHSGCSPCTLPCQRTRSCEHPCPLPCHSGACPRCGEELRLPCHCTRSTISLACTDFQQVRICLYVPVPFGPIPAQSLMQTPLVDLQMQDHYAAIAAWSHVRQHSFTISCMY